MNHTEKIQHRFGHVQKKLGFSLIFSWLIPWVLYIIIRPMMTNDTTALALVGVIPVVRTLTLIAWRRRVDWISVGGSISFLIALTFSLLLGGSSLPFKLFRPVLTGTLGLAFLASAIIKKPLLLILIKAFKNNASDKFTSDSMTNRQIAFKKMTLVTVIVGLILVADAAAHIIMAISLPTGTFLLMSRIVTIVAIVILFGARWLIGRKSMIDE